MRVIELGKLSAQDKFTVVGSLLICTFFVYEKVTNDVTPFDALTVACTQAEIESVAVEQRESILGLPKSPVLRFDVRGGDKGTIHGRAPYWDAVLASVRQDRKVCIWFDPDSRTHTVYQIQLQGVGVVLDYEAVARWNAWNLNALLLSSLAFTLIYVPYVLSGRRRRP
jgi:hypothetical protein